MKAEHFKADMIWRIKNQITANDTAKVDKIDRWMLDLQTRALLKCLVTIKSMLPFEAVRWAGPNWRGPMIEHLISDSERIRERTA